MMTRGIGLLKCRTRRAVPVLVAAILLVPGPAWAPAARAFAGQAGEAAAESAPPLATQEGYVGVAKCASCHQVQADGYNKGPHSIAWDVRSPAAERGCETCHGPGQAHVADVGAKGRLRNFKKLEPREVSATCTTCHNRSEHALWQGSTHEQRNVACTSCHTVHTPQSEKGHLKLATVIDTCAQCHRDKAARLQRVSHMPVREGKMTCTTCHNQHGSTNVRMLRVGNTVNELCWSCHAEKRGPVLWDHPPVRENCATCHDPHGSSNDRMLVAKVPMLCQRCHTHTQHPSTVYDAVTVANRSNRIVSRGCVQCHSNVHGSNHPSGAFFHR